MTRTSPARPQIRYLILVAVVSVFLFSDVSTPAQQREISLDGTWQITDSISGDAIPDRFDHTVPVPGLAHSAVPTFPDVDRFDSRELIGNLLDAS